MILQCPECNTRFRVEREILLPQGRKLRCTSCAHVWFQKPTDGRDAAKPGRSESFAAMVEDIAAGESAPKKSKSKKEKPVGPSIKDRVAALMARLRGTLAGIDARAVALKGGSAVFGAAVMGGILLGVFVGGREQIVLRAPSLYNTYLRLGLPVTAPGTGLVFEQPAAEWAFDAKGEPVLALKGAILNTADTPRHVPPLRATLIMKSGARGDSRTIQTVQSILEPKGKDPFVVQLPEWRDNIGANTGDVLLSFAIEELDTAGSTAGHAEPAPAPAPDAGHDAGHDASHNGGHEKTGEALPASQMATPQMAPKTLKTVPAHDDHAAPEHSEEPAASQGAAPHH